MKNLFLVLGVSLIFSCQNIERVDSPAIREQIKSRQPKQISAVQFTSIADSWGGDFSKSIINELETELKKPKADVASLCQLKGLRKTDSVSKIYQLKLALLGRKDLTNKQLETKSLEVLDALAYNAENKLAPVNNVQKIQDSLMLYSAQLPYSSSVCAICMNSDPTKFAVLSIIIPKRAIARNITVKELKKIK